MMVLELDIKGMCSGVWYTFWCFDDWRGLNVERVKICGGDSELLLYPSKPSGYLCDSNPE